MRSDWDKENDLREAKEIADQFIMLLNDAGIIPDTSMDDAYIIGSTKIADRILDYGNAIRKETAKSFVECFTEKEREMQ